MEGRWNIQVVLQLKLNVKKINLNRFNEDFNQCREKSVRLQKKSQQPNGTNSTIQQAKPVRRLDEQTQPPRRVDRAGQIQFNFCRLINTSIALSAQLVGARDIVGGLFIRTRTFGWNRYFMFRIFFLYFVDTWK